jgi:hypothetical protein
MHALIKEKLDAAKRRSRGDYDKRVWIPENFILLLSPVVQALLWVAALAWGAAASLLSTEIMSFTFPWDDQAGSPNWHTISFGVSAVVLAFVFAVGQWVARCQDSIMVDSMITMPPHDFWTYYGSEYTRASAIVENATVQLLDEETSWADREQYRQSHFNEDIRRLLNAVINLVKKWDSSNLQGGNIVYRANLMTIWRFEDGELADQSVLAERFTIQPANSHYSGYVGLLDNAYTTTTATDGPDTDPDCQPIVFPFTEPNAKLLEPFHSNLLGAPCAAAVNTPSYVPDVQHIILDYDKNSSNSNKRIRERLVEYYSDASIAQSILAIPICPIDEARPAWILNVYRNQGGLLFDGEKVRDFAEIIKPYTGALARMMYATLLHQGLEPSHKSSADSEEA